MIRQFWWLRFGVVLFAAGPTSFGQNADSNLKPDDNRFTVVRLTPPNDLNEPMVFEVLPDGRAFIIERRGTVKFLDPATQTVKPVGALAVNNRVRQGNGEQGLVGMTLDPKFAGNGWMYLYYQHPTEEKSVLSRWEIRDNLLVANSEKVMLDWPAQRETCCHTGGGMTWDDDDNLFLTVGNNRGNNISAHTDERPGRAAWDDQGGAANSNSLEGKILRIHPEPDGTYSIPRGNLFPPGTPKTRPEIYTMGHRNAWRVSVDPQTGFLYWGEVGPDARQESERGPLSYDEFNQARGPGFFGWPYFTGVEAYPHWDYAADKAGAKYDPQRPVNHSPNNTGLTELPPVSPAFVYYPYQTSDKFPALGSGGRSATGGPIFRRARFKAPKRPYPAYYEGRWFAAEFSRRMIALISMKENGDFQSLERFLPNYKPVEPIDAKFGPEGDLYVLEYGGRWFQASPDAKLVRIEFEAGNRKPMVVASADKTGGIPPFEVKLSAAGTRDFDGDPLSYQWDVIDFGGNARSYREASPTVKLESQGTYLARLTVTDPSGASDTRTVKIVSGNEPPKVAVKIEGNESFYFADRPFGYTVDVSDKEDGGLKDGGIKPESVEFSIDHASADFDMKSLTELPAGEEALVRFPVAQALISKGNCKACHLVEGKLVGPSFSEIAARYRGTPGVAAQLAKKVITGGSGVWSPVAMPPNGLIGETDAATILEFVLSLGAKSLRQLPLTGTYTPQLPEGDDGSGLFIIRAAYTDKGEEVAPPLASQSIVVLRSPVLGISRADRMEGVEPGGFGASVAPGGFLAFQGIDLSGIKQVNVSASAVTQQGHKGGDLEVRLDAPDGRLLGQTKIEAQEFRPGGGQRGGAPRAAPSAGAPAAASAGPDDAPRPETVLPAATPTAETPAARPARAGGRGRGFGPPPKAIALMEVSGRHDLYFVFKNDSAKPGDVLMTVSRLVLDPLAAAP